METKFKCANCDKYCIQNKYVKRKFCSNTCANRAKWPIRNQEQKFFRNKINRIAYSAKRRKLSVSITSDDLYNLYLKQEGKCYYTGRLLKLDKDSSKKRNRKNCGPDQCSVDRIDSSKGYHPDNIVLCCFAINAFKGDLTLEEFSEYLNLATSFHLKNIKVKKLHPDAVIPTRAYSGDAGLDLTAISVKYENGYYEYGTGLAFELPENTFGMLAARSSISNKDLMLCNGLGILDQGFRGEVKLRFKPLLNEFGMILPDRLYKPGDRIAQLIVSPLPRTEFEEVIEFSESDRKEGGFGSSKS